MNFFFSLSFFPTMGLGLVSKDFAYLTLGLLFFIFCLNLKNTFSKEAYPFRAMGKWLFVIKWLYILG